MAHTTAFNGIGCTYTDADLAVAKAANRCTPSGVYYHSNGQVGKKTAGYTLMKEAHQTRDEIRRSKKWLVQGSGMLAEVSTAKPETA